MPGANYFLSKVASQIPGPLVSVGPFKAKNSCMEIVPFEKSLDEYTGSSYMHSTDPVEPVKNGVSVIGDGYIRPEITELSYLSSSKPQPWGYQSVEIPITLTGIEENPVGELQELCTKMKWPFPSYTVCSEYGQPHERTFVVAGRLYNLKIKGEAKSKKAAKREAARHILLYLLERSRTPGFSVNPLNLKAIEDQPHTDLPPRQTQPFPSRKSFPSNKRDGRAVPNVACLDILQDLARRKNFEVTYHTLDSKTPSGCYQVMLQILSSPVIICRGQGKTVLAAKADAAINALDCLRLTAKQISESQMLTFKP